MESEKVKEIKKALKFCCDDCDCDCPFYKNGKSYEECKSLLLFEALTLINELESENEKLKQHKRELEGGQRDLLKVIKEFDKETQQLKDRIVELEDGYARGYADGIKNTYEVVVPDKLEAFAKWLSKRSNNLIYIELVEKFIKECL